MKNIKSRQAFTMTELIFVIVVIGILAAVAIPRLSLTRDDAEITKARTMVASVRNALAMERQKRILRGRFLPLSRVGGNTVGSETYVFGNFYENNSTDDIDTGVSVLEYAELNSTANGDWSVSGGTYTFHCRALGGSVDFTVTGGRFVCNDDTIGCQQLTR